MATNGKTQNLETFVKQQLGGAQKRLAGLEQEANKVLRTLKTRTKGQAREVESPTDEVNEMEAALAATHGDSAPMPAPTRAGGTQTTDAA